MTGNTNDCSAAINLPDRLNRRPFASFFWRLLQRPAIHRFGRSGVNVH